MAKVLPQSVQDAMDLDAENRSKLGKLLLDSLDVTDPEVDRLWIEKFNRRLVADHAGTMKTVSTDEFFREFESLNTVGLTLGA